MQQLIPTTRMTKREQFDAIQGGIRTHIRLPDVGRQRIENHNCQSRIRMKAYVFRRRGPHRQMTTVNNPQRAQRHRKPTGMRTGRTPEPTHLAPCTRCIETGSIATTDSPTVFQFTTVHPATTTTTAATGELPHHVGGIARCWLALDFCLKMKMGGSLARYHTTLHCRNSRAHDCCERTPERVIGPQRRR